MFALIKGLPLKSTAKLLAIVALALFVWAAYQNHQALKAQLLAQQEKIGAYKLSQAQAKQTNDDNNQTISQLKNEIVAQQERQARHEKALSIAEANHAQTNQELADLRANNEHVKKWLDTSHHSAINRLLNNARARYTNSDQKGSDKIITPGALSSAR